MSQPAEQTAGQQVPARGSVLTIATLNVCTLKGRMPEVLQLASSYALDILCLQEVRLTENNILAAIHTAKKSGWHFLPGPCALDSAGMPTAGVAFLSRWPLDKFIFDSLPVEMQFQQGRWLTVRVHRPGARPFFCTNVYLHASGKTEKRCLAEKLFETIATGGDEVLFIGDWNCTPEEQPVSNVLRNGQLHLADDIAGAEVAAIPTRAGGRHIDFALYSVGLVPCARSQARGLADHDLVMYEFAVSDIEPFFRVQRPLRLAAESPVKDEVWSQSFPDKQFEEMLSCFDVQQAWNLLSDCAESVLQPQPGRKRSKIPSPTQCCLAPTKVERVQSVLERRARRTLRRLCEMQKPCSPWCLVRKIRCDLVYLQKHFPELSELHELDPCMQEALKRCIQQEVAASQEARLKAWRKRMNEDEASLIRWVKGADQSSSFATADPQVPVHPQSKADFFADFWSKIWCPPNGVPIPDLTPFLDWVPPDGFACPAIDISAQNLICQAKRAVGKASGPDGWSGHEWSLLPHGFFAALAQLWNAVLQCGALPEQWHVVRCVLIPKEVGLRPISIASLAWRVGLGVVAQQLSPWIDAWAPQEFVGGLKARCAASAHEDLHAALQWPRLFGAKIDIAKCFDHVTVSQALDVWRRLGAPTSVLKVLQAFYQNQLKTMEWQGFCPAKHSLRQRPFARLSF